MTIVNQLILYALAAFMVLGAIDRVIMQFRRGSPSGSIWSRFAQAIEGAGSQFEEGLNAMGPLALAMVGVMAATPVLSRLLAPLVIPAYQWLGASPAMFATSLLAIDMGGYSLARDLATQNGVLDWASFLYAGLILGSMLGATIVFSIPVGLGIINREDQRPFALGVLIGLVTIPMGCIAGGVTAMFTGVATPSGDPVHFTIGMLLRNLVPVIILSTILALGLWKFTDSMIKGFTVFSKLLVCLITAALGLAAFEVLTGRALGMGLDPIFPITGDQPGIDRRAIELVGRTAIALMGAYPAVHLLSRWFRKPLLRAGQALGINEFAAAGLVASLANSIPMFKLMFKMDQRGKVLNAAFSVGAAFVFADHLAFTAANKPDMIVSVIAGKLVAGMAALLLALLILRSKESSGSA